MNGVWNGAASMAYGGQIFYLMLRAVWLEQLNKQQWID